VNARREMAARGHPFGGQCQGTGHRAQHRAQYVCGSGETMGEEALAPTSLPPAQADPARLLARWPGHWPIENGSYGVRDVKLVEDASRVRSGHAPSVVAARRTTCPGLPGRAGYPNLAVAMCQCS
jgi:hypothetical protein